MTHVPYNTTIIEVIVKVKGCEDVILKFDLELLRDCYYIMGADPHQLVQEIVLEDVKSTLKKNAIYPNLNYKGE